MNKKEQKKVDPDLFQALEQSQNLQSKNVSEDSKYEQMKKSYEVSAWYAKSKLQKEDPDLASALENVEESNVIVVRGGYDKCQLVLRLADIPYTLIGPPLLEQVELRPDQTVFINCPGNLGRKAIGRLVTFVREGGLLITTDWALKNVLEIGFPDKLQYNQRPTGDEVVRITVKDPSNPMVKGFMEAGGDPVWWLEGSSYPIKILDKENVRVLVLSKELEERYGESPVIVEFDHEKGKVVHMISHFYLQRTETRDKKDQMAAETVIEKELYDQAPDEIKGKFKSTSTAEFKAAQSSISFLQKNIAQQKKKYMDEKESKE